MSLTAVEIAEDRADPLPDYPTFHRERLNRSFYSLTLTSSLTDHYSLIFPTDCLVGQQSNL